MGCEASRDADIPSRTASTTAPRGAERLPDVGHNHANPLGFSSITLGSGGGADGAPTAAAPPAVPLRQCSSRSGRANNKAPPAASTSYRRDDPSEAAPLTEEVLAQHNTLLLERRKAELDAAVATSKTTDAPVVVRLSFFKPQERALLWLEYGVEEP